MDTASFHVHLNTGSEALQLQKSCGTVIGELNPHYSKLLRVLQYGESIELQTIVVHSLAPHTSSRQPTNRGRKAGRVKAKFPTLSVVLYGSMDMFESIGDFLSQCSEYLQPPLRCDRNVPYYNPQSLAGSKADPQMTFQLQSDVSLSGVEAIAQGADPSAALETEDLNPEMEAPAAVKSFLYRYVSSRKRHSQPCLALPKSLADCNQSSKASAIVHAHEGAKYSAVQQANRRMESCFRRERSHH